MNVDAGQLAVFMQITVAADKLEEFLTANIGSNADWPADSDAAGDLVKLLNGLQDALKPYRETKKKDG